MNLIIGRRKLYMEYLLGLLTAVVFFIVFFAGKHVGQQSIKRPKPPDVDEKEQQEMKSFNEDFRKLFNYDVAQATARKKV